MKIKKPDSSLALSSAAPPTGSLDNLDQRFAGGLNPQVKSYIMREIGQRDQQIRQLTTETEELRKHIRALEHDNEDKVRRLHDVEEYVCHVVAGFDFDEIADTIEEGIDAMSARIAEQQQTITDIKKGNQRHIDQGMEHNKAIKSLKDELLKLTQLNNTLQTQLEELTAKYNTETKDLQQRLSQKESKLVATEKKLQTTEHWHLQSSTSVEHELHQTHETIKVNRRTIAELTKERDRYKEQTEQLEFKCRRLLNSLNLDNNCDEMTLSLDHARNMSYVRRRKSLQEQPKVYLSRRDSRKEFKVNVVNQTNDAESPRRNTKSEKDSVNSSSLITDSDYFSNDNSSVSSNPLKPLKNFKKDSSNSLNSLTSSSDFITTNPNSNNGTPRNGFRTSNNNGSPRSNGNGLTYITNPGTENGRITEEEEQPSCVVCGRVYDENSNFEGACVFHKHGAVKLHEGTEMEVWSCCKSVNTIKGCQKARHAPLVR